MTREAKKKLAPISSVLWRCAKTCKCAPFVKHTRVARAFCSLALVQVGTALPFYPGKGPALGAVLTMSRYPCSSDDAVLAGQCCRKQKCANYSGAHVVSRGCILYGTLEAELAVHIPGGAM